MMHLCHVELRSAAFTVTVCLNISEGLQCRLTGSAQSTAVAATWQQTETMPKLLL